MEKPDNRALLIFDLDETLIFSSEVPLAFTPKLRFEKYEVHTRPYLETSLITLSNHFNLAVWSSAGNSYVETIVESIKPKNIDFQFVWGESRCTLKYDPDTGSHFSLKNLKKVKRKGYSLGRTLIIDNTPSKVSANYGNAIYINDFLGNPEDQELLALTEYLIEIKECTDFRRIEKRHWRK